MITQRWSSFEVPDIEGVVTASGAAYEFQGIALVGTDKSLVSEHWLEVAVLATLDVYGRRYRVKCGEASAHGSIGVIVLEDIPLNSPVWVLVSARSNPFDQIILKGGHVLVLSTSGAVFRFRPELEDAALLI
jgi:hypothetical protein